MMFRDEKDSPEHLRKTRGRVGLRWPLLGPSGGSGWTPGVLRGCLMFCRLCQESVDKNAITFTFEQGSSSLRSSVDMYADKHCTLGREEVQENRENFRFTFFLCCLKTYILSHQSIKVFLPIVGRMSMSNSQPLKIC